MGDVTKDFDEAVRIRKGEGELPGYEVIKAWIVRAPETWLPGLLAQCVAGAVSKKCFKDAERGGDSGLIYFVRRWEAYAKNPGSILRAAKRGSDT